MEKVIRQKKRYENIGFMKGFCKVRRLFVSEILIIKIHHDEKGD